MLIRQNARRPNEMRELIITTDSVLGTDGACQVSMGGTKASCTVECHYHLKGIHIVYNESGRMKWQRQQGSVEHPSSSEADVVEWVKKALLPSMVAATNQDAGWIIVLEAISDDGSIESACTIAATTALSIAVNHRSSRNTDMNGGAGVHLRHQVMSVTLGTFGGDIAVDLDKGEMQAAEMLAHFAVTSYGAIAKMNLDTRLQECRLAQLMTMAEIAVEHAKGCCSVINSAVNMAREFSGGGNNHLRSLRIG